MTTKPIPHPIPEDPDDSDAIMEHLADAVTGDDGYWPNRVRNAFAKAGLAVTRLEREPYHPVWSIWLNVGSIDFSADRKLASRHIRKALAKAGLKIPAGELDVIEQRRGIVKAALLFGSVLPSVDIMGI